VSGSQCESAGNVEINNTPTTHFTPQYPMLGDACCFITAVARSQMRLVVGDSVRSNTLADPRLHQRARPAGKITGVANKVSSIPLPLLQA